MNAEDFRNYLATEGGDLARERARIVQWEVHPSSLSLIPVRWNGYLRTRAGRCKWQGGSPSIELNPSLRQEDNNLDAASDTFVHELAHALLKPREGHSPTWLALYRRLGGKGARQHNFKTMRPRRRPRHVVGHCQECGEVIRRATRLPSTPSYFHVNCGGLIIPK